MKTTIKFARQHVFPSAGIVLGACWAIYGILSGAYGLWTAGLPDQVWTAVGAGIFFLSVAAVLIRWSSERDSVSVSPEPQNVADADWQAKLVHVAGQHFLNREVVLDGHAYRGCKFENVTFKYGGGPMVFEGNNVGQHTIEPTSDEAIRIVSLLITFGHMKTQIFDRNGPISPDEWDRRHELMRK